ncbi:hypothetical protein OAI_18915 [Vibrio cyclitrophicus FF160]|nr:hypothetical protein OAI_18915 [Vibrio cyclitrophicus FF160]OEF28404.1 hypothetical protein OA9_13565 [Vibrio cyclitrophicus 1F97]OEF75217.1 hypothetical protein OA5_06645 [Vibrio cyclitrophicus 1F111]PMI43918.1 hypothetical protein BCU44_19185 [Vibrio cyclitrophicus]PMJ19849.1 hypothetical protein BCU28_14445 [Vibrio cyclitrophicus]
MLIDELSEQLRHCEDKLGRVDLCCTFRVKQYIDSHINMNASDNMLARFLSNLSYLLEIAQ